MGVGVYSNNFTETGGTFLVDGPDCSDDEYQSSTGDMDEDDVPDLDTWIQDQYDFQRGAMDEAITKVLQAVGLVVGANSERDFEHEFHVHTRDKGFVIGTRGWESDAVVGVWQDEEYGEYEGNVNGDVVEMALRDGVMPERLCARRRKIADDLLELIRVQMQDRGIDCRFKTSGYTSTQYPRLEGEEFSQRCNELVAGIRADLAWVSRPYEQALREEGAENFKDIIKLVVKEEPGWYRDSVSAGFLLKGQDGVAFGVVDEDLNVAYDSVGALHASELNLSPEFPPEVNALPLPETPEIMAACIECHLKHLAFHCGRGASQPYRFSLPPSAVKEVLGLGAKDELVFSAFDEEEPAEPDGPGMS